MRDIPGFILVSTTASEPTAWQKAFLDACTPPIDQAYARRLFNAAAIGVAYFEANPDGTFTLMEPGEINA